MVASLRLHPFRYVNPLQIWCYRPPHVPSCYRLSTLHGKWLRKGSPLTCAPSHSTGWQVGDLEAIRHSIPAGRIGDPAAFGKVIAFLAATANFITGASPSGWWNLRWGALRSSGLPYFSQKRTTDDSAYCVIPLERNDHPCRYHCDRSGLR